MRIGIIGAGIAGLVAAAALQSDGHRVRVFERRSAVNPVGAGLSLFGNAFAALRTVGLADAVEALASPSIAEFTAGQRSPSGTWLTVMPSDAMASLRAVHRADLHSMLTDLLAPGTLTIGTEATADPDGLPHLVVNGERVSFDLVIAADGIRSASRRELGLDPGLRYAGYTAWRGVTAAPVAIDGAAGETWGRGRRFGVVPLRDGRVYWFATDNLPARTTFEDERAAVLARFSEWHRPIRDLVLGTPAGAVLRNDIHDLAAPLPSFVRHRTVLIGDAAHAMTPDLGQGAGQAIEDAATLVVLLRGAKTPVELDAALDRFDRLRRPRTKTIAGRSRMMGRIGQVRGPVAVRLRDLALTLTPDALIARGATAIQHWAPPDA